MGVLHFNQTVVHHVIERWQDFLDLLGRLDELNSDGQIAGQFLDLRRVQLLMRAEPGKRPCGRGAGYPLVHEKRQDGIVQGLHVILRRLVHENCDLARGSFR